MYYNLENFNPKTVYLSMGAFLEPHIRTYAGGLEILAGDTLRSYADLGHKLKLPPLAAVILACNKGYSKQVIDENGWQHEEWDEWDTDRLPVLDTTVQIGNYGKPLNVGAMVYVVRGRTGFEIPVFLMNTNLKSNTEEDREITSHLYSNEVRISQENVLGQGFVKLAKKLGFNSIENWWMNEGHAALLTLALKKVYGFSRKEVIEHSVFTNHTPVPAGHDKFDYDTVSSALGDGFVGEDIRALAGDDEFNMTLLALNMSRCRNGVSRQHKLVLDELDEFKGRKVDYITNGVHLPTWVGEDLADLYQTYLGNFQADPSILEMAPFRIPADAVWEAKKKQKIRLVEYVNNRTDVQFNPDALTIVWARRFAPYKRPLLLFRNPGQIHAIADDYATQGGLQVIYTGKAHPNNIHGKEMMQELYKNPLSGNLKRVFIPGYDIEVAKYLVQGADVWLNTPRRPLEASGTSGMKAAANGGINNSIADGWWLEAIDVNPRAGWTIGPITYQTTQGEHPLYEDWEDSESLYRNLREIANIYYGNKKAFAEFMLTAISLASHFNTDRMVRQYVENALTK